MNMAFMGRGGFPSINNESEDNTSRGYRYRRGLFYCYVPLDNTYVVMQMIATLIIIVVGGITFFATYKSTIVDPIASTKKIFVNTYLIIIGIFLATTIIINSFSRSKTELVKRLAITLAISIIVMIVFLGIKLNLDTIYTKEKFEQIYTEQNANENISETSNKKAKSKVDIGLTGVKIKTEKEYYIDECSKLYGIFSTKAYGSIRTSFST